jgi:hypothetical protein
MAENVSLSVPHQATTTGQGFIMILAVYVRKAQEDSTTGKYIKSMLDTAAMLATPHLKTEEERKSLEQFKAQHLMSPQKQQESQLIVVPLRQRIDKTIYSTPNSGTKVVIEAVAAQCMAKSVISPTNELIQHKELHDQLRTIKVKKAELPFADGVSVLGHNPDSRHGFPCTSETVPKLLQLAATNKAKKEAIEAAKKRRKVDAQEKKDALKAQRLKDRDRVIAVLQEAAAPQAALMRRDFTLPTLRNALQVVLSVEEYKEASKLKKPETVALIITKFGAGGCNAAALLAESQKNEELEELEEELEEQDDDEEETE